MLEGEAHLIEALMVLIDHAAPPQAQTARRDRKASLSAGSTCRSMLRRTKR
jgi:hypothetical protein